MSSSRIKMLDERDAVDFIVETVKDADGGRAPFALVLGAGFSRGLVPTARELITEALPLWIKASRKREEFEALRKLPAEQRVTLTRDFWRDFCERNATLGLRLELDAVTGLPGDYAAAYMACFNPSYRKAVGEPAQARRFQREIMRLDHPRLNAAHFLLASLLGVQPGLNRPSRLFNSSAAFCRLILTTNFDPFLQTALQAVNRLYFMSDTPDLGLTDEIIDDDTDAIHLVYVHGTVHRRSQAASEDDIRVLKQRNARMLAPALKRRGVIVLGYSGWDDAIVAALAECESFNHRLYWCGLAADPRAAGAFGPRVAEILDKPSAFYVQTRGAGFFMAELCKGLVKGLPRLLDNPIGQLRDLLDMIDLQELENFPTTVSSDRTISQLVTAGSGDAFVQAKKSVLDRLREVEAMFLGQVSSSAARDALVPDAALALTGGTQRAAKQAERLASAATLAVQLGKHDDAVQLLTEALGNPNVPRELEARLLVLRGALHHFAGRFEAAELDWTTVWSYEDAPAEYRAKAMISRGSSRGQRGEVEKALLDFGAVVAMAYAPAEQRAQALFNRAVTWGERGEVEKELADYEALLAMADASSEQRAQAMVNRGIRWGRRAEPEKALADFDSVVAMADAPAEQRAMALSSRGVTWGLHGAVGKALADFDAVIEMADAPEEQRAQALCNRGITWFQCGEEQKALADYDAVIAMADAPAEQRAQALYNRAVTWGQRGEVEKELADYEAIIAMADAPAEQRAWALHNRAVTWGQRGEVEKELADYEAIIAMADASSEQRATALLNRGFRWGQRGELDMALADYEAVVAMVDAPAKLRAVALANRGWSAYQQGKLESSLADSQAAIKLDPTIVRAHFNAALALLACGRDAEALAAYSEAAVHAPSGIDAHVAQVERAASNWLTSDRAEPVLALLRAAREHAAKPPTDT